MFKFSVRSISKIQPEYWNYAKFLRDVDYMTDCMLISQLAFYVNLYRAVIGPSATLTGRWRPDIDLRRMLTGLLT